jgi:Na+/melibiose symporter-like transporter
MDNEQFKTVYDALVAEITYRREKQWKIFSWSSTLLVGITAGVIALTFEKGKQLDEFSRLLLIFSVVVLTAYSWLWCNRNIKFEEAARKELEGSQKALQIPTLKVKWPDWLGYGPTLLLLALAAIATIWFAPNPNP